MEKEIESNESKSILPLSNNKEYFYELKKQCLSIDSHQFSFGQDLIKKIYPIIRNYEIEIQGEENIPKGENVLFVANHSNSHDIFTAYELFSMLQRRGSVMVATDCLNLFTTSIFNISNATLLDRRNKKDRENSILTLSKKILDGSDGLIFGEGTWNIHPVLPMHNIKNGAAKVSLITQVPIVPVIFEYIENNSFVLSDRELYKKCVIRFGKPIMINYNDTLSRQSKQIQEEMIVLRKQLWSTYGIRREEINEIDPCVYVNHTYAKKFKALGFSYDSKIEQEYLLFLANELHENEYTINQAGEFVPGITDKKNELRKILKF